MQNKIVLIFSLNTLKMFLLSINYINNNDYNITGIPLVIMIVWGVSKIITPMKIEVSSIY